MRNLGWLCIFVVGCGSSGGGKTPDASNVPATITLSGTASDAQSGSALASVAVGAFKSSDETNAVMTATTDASGNFTMTITTNGQALDGYIQGTKSGYVDTYLYPPTPVSANYTGATVLMVTPGTFGLLYTVAQVGGQTPGDGSIALKVEDASGMPVAGATISSTPAGMVRYNGTGTPAVPDKNATSTQADGIAYVLNVAAGQVTVSAAKSGLTFKSHAVKARADVVTETLITE